MRAKYAIQLIVTAVLLFAAACSSTKHLPEGEYLLDNVSVSVDDRKDVSSAELYNFLRQIPNHKVLGFAKLQLGTYNLSGRDTTKWYNRWLRRVGQPPVIYDHSLTDASCRQLQLALLNKGYLDASVVADTVSHKSKRIDVHYHIVAGEPHRIASVGYNIADSAISEILLGDTSALKIRSGMLLDRNALDEERGRITRRLRDAGYYDFNREYINFTADTIAGSKMAALTMNLRTPAQRRLQGMRVDTLGLSLQRHHDFYIRSVTFMLADPTEKDGRNAPCDTVTLADGVRVIYGEDHYLRPKVLDEMCYLVVGKKYSAADVERTYEALGRLSIVKFINIDLQPCGSFDDSGLLDAVIYMSRTKKMSAAVELEGTNSEGDFGFGLGLTYQHHNLAKGSELLTAKVRASYESLSGDFDQLITNRYTEYAAEVGVTIPKFECPFLSKSFKQKRRASTEFSLSANYQERPEYTRIILGTAWKWNWQQQRADYLRRQTFDLVDINYVRLPRSTINFIDEIAPTNPLLRYSYEDHFIMRMGYTFSRTNRRVPTATVNAFAIQPYVSSLRVSGEIAGNLLYAMSNIFDHHRSGDVYKIFGIQYAQYVKGEVDYTYTRNFNSRNALAFHVGAGVAYPYGNSTMVPFEKRFYAGGANGVRGWGVRTLGPGAYNARNSVTDFINQCGDIRLDLSLEYRAKLFWVLESALFIDAGNIWTIKAYENQPGGEFKFNEFYKQIAAAYGVGLRMDFTYFLLRLDLGFKAYNPARDQERWPLTHFKWSRDANFHFSVGYPF